VATIIKPKSKEVSLWKRFATKKDQPRTVWQLNAVEFYLFSFIGLAMAGVAWFCLFTAGMVPIESMPARSFPGSAATIILCYTVALFVWPIIKAIRHFKSHRTLSKTRLIMMGVMLLVIMVGMRFWLLTSNAGAAQALHVFVIMGHFALVLSITVALKLLFYPPESVETAQWKTQKAIAEREIADRTAVIESDTKSLNVQSQKTIALTENESDAKVVASEADAVFKAAEAAHKTSEASRLFEVASGEVSTRKKQVEALEKQIKLLKSSKTEQAAEKARLSLAREQLEYAEARKTELETNLLLSDAHKALGQAVVAKGIADQAVTDATTKLDTSTTEEARLQTVIETNTTIVADERKKLDEADSALSKIAGNNRSDMALSVIIVPVVLYLSSYFLYAAWYGWVITERG
jgi:hypothetical protein